MRKLSIAEQQKLVYELVGFLKKENIPVIGFISENQLYENGAVAKEKIWLNAQNAHRLFSIFGEKNYSFISLTDTLKDKAYKSSIHKRQWNFLSGSLGINSLQTQGIFLCEPCADKWVMDYANIDGE